MDDKRGGSHSKIYLVFWRAASLLPVRNFSLFLILLYQSGPAKPRTADQKRIFSRDLIQIHRLMEIWYGSKNNLIFFSPDFPPTVSTMFVSRKINYGSRYIARGSFTISNFVLSIFSLDLSLRTFISFARANTIRENAKSSPLFSLEKIISNYFQRIFRIPPVLFSPALNFSWLIHNY